MFLSIVIFSCIVKTKTFTVTVFLRYARLDKNYRHIHFLLLCEYMTYIFILLCFILYDKFISCYIYFRFAKSIWNLFSNLFGYRMQVIWDKTRLRLAYLFLLRIVHRASHPILYPVFPFNIHDGSTVRRSCIFYYFTKHIKTMFHFSTLFTENSQIQGNVTQGYVWYRNESHLKYDVLKLFLLHMNILLVNFIKKHLIIFSSRHLAKYFFSELCKFCVTILCIWVHSFNKLSSNSTYPKCVFCRV